MSTTAPKKEMSAQTKGKNIVPLQIASIVLNACGIVLITRTLILGHTHRTGIVDCIPMLAMAAALWCMYFGTRAIRGNKIVLTCGIVVTVLALLVIILELIPTTG